MGFGGATGYGGRRARRRERRSAARTTTRTASAEARSPTRSIGSGCTRASSRRSRPRPVDARRGRSWTTTLVAGAAGAILTLAVLGGGRRDRRLVEQRPARPPSPPACRSSTAQALAVAVAHSVVAVSARDDDGTRRGSGVCVRAFGRDPHERPPGRERDDGRTSRPPTAPCTRRASSGATPRPTSCCSRSTADTSGRSSPAAAKLGVPCTPRPTRRGRATRLGRGRAESGRHVAVDEQRLVASIDSLVAIDDGPTTSGLLETAAASSPASSGGALVDRAGDVTGIVLAPRRRRRAGHLRRADRDRVGDRRRSPRRTATRRTARSGINGVNSPAGPTVTEVVAGGPAERRRRAGRRRRRIGRRATRSTRSTTSWRSCATTGRASRSSWGCGGARRRSA